MDDGAKGGEGEMVDTLDEADGIIKNIFSRGKYRPKQNEIEAWGPDGPSGNEPMEEENPGNLIDVLLSQTTEWRKSLNLMLTDSKSEASVRKCLVFLHKLVKTAIDIMETEVDAVGKSVHFESNSAPPDIKAGDVMSIVSGLKFNLESPGTVRNIDYVDISIGPDTNKDVLTGFCHLLQCMLELQWTNLRILLNMEEKEGSTIFSTVAMLDAGYGISEQVKAPLVRLNSKYPSVFKSLGFQNIGDSKLQWQKPFDPKEYDLLHGSLHGLFRSVKETML